MKLVEQTTITKTDNRYGDIMEYCHLSKNLYNATLYSLRQHYFDTNKYLSYPEQHKQFVRENNPDYRALPTKVAKQTMKAVHNNMSSFFSSIKSNNVRHKIGLPRYKKKDGYFSLIVDKESIKSKPVSKDKNGVYTYSICPRGINLHFHTKQRNIKQVRFIPRREFIIQEVVYEIQDVEVKNNERYMSVDIGVNNLMAIYSNCGESLIFPGGVVKSVNQYYNKKIARKKSMLHEGRYTSKHIDSLWENRNNKMNDLLHKASAELVKHAVSQDVSTIIIGYNKEWKQATRMGKVNNQKFCFIPFMKLISMIEYKAKMVGITTIRTEESYTSKTSFLDKESTCKHDTYVGRRVHRGLFRSHDGHKINADINGSGQIMRKVVPDNLVYTSEGIEGCRTPRTVSYWN